MKTLPEIVRGELIKEIAEVALTEYHEVFETLAPHGLHKSLRVWITVRAAGWNADALHPAGLEQLGPRFREHRVPIVNEMRRVAKESALRIEQISVDLHHPSAVRVNSDASDVHGSGVKLHHEKYHHADGAEWPQGLYAEEIARVQRLPMALQELLPGSSPSTLWGRLNARLRQSVRDRTAADVDLQAAQGIPDLRVTPAGSAASRISSWASSAKPALISITRAP